MAVNGQQAMQIQLNTKHYECSALEIQRMEQALGVLAESVRAFPVSILHVTVIHHPRSQDFHVKTSLVLTGRTLFTGTRHFEMYTAYERCIDKLVDKVAAYKGSLGRVAEQSKTRQGTYQDVIPTDVPNFDAIHQAIEEGDYAAFRQAMSIYDEPVRRRLGRWVQRYPELNAVIGERLEIGDLVEGVFLTAFEDYENRSKDVLPGDWLEQLIDREIQDLADDPESELENISMVQTARAVETTE